MNSRTVLEQIAGDLWKDIFKPILVFLIKALAILTVIGITAYIVMLFMAHSAISKMTDPENHELQTFASALPLFCTVEEIDENEEEFALLADFAYEVDRKKSKCTNSLEDAADCGIDAWEALHDPRTYTKGYKKGKRLNQARKKVKGIIQRTVARVKAIEPFDENSAELKKDMLSLAVYINNNANAWDVAINSERIGKEIDRRGTKILGKNMDDVCRDIWNKYPQSVVLIFKPVYMVFADNNELKEAVMRSKAFRDATGSDGCVPLEEDTYIAPAVILGFAALLGMMEKDDEPATQADAGE